MAHSLLRLVTTQPELLAEHAQGYVELAAEELRICLAYWQRRLLLVTLAVVSAAVAAALGGVALLLWVLTPHLPPGAAWLLWAVPACPLALTLGCVAGLRTSVTTHPWQAVQAQLVLDVAAWRTPNAT